MGGRRVDGVDAALHGRNARGGVTVEGRRDGLLLGGGVMVAVVRGVLRVLADPVRGGGTRGALEPAPPP